MAYDESLADRVRDVLADEPDVQEKRMFGGICVMVAGHMAAGIINDDLMVGIYPKQGIGKTAVTKHGQRGRRTARRGAPRGAGRPGTG